MNSTAPQNASAAVEDGLSTSTAVTKVIDRIPRAGMEARLEQSIENFIAAAKFQRLPGHLGVTVIRPSLPAQPGFRIVYRFDSCGICAAGRIGRICAAPGINRRWLHARGTAPTSPHGNGNLLHTANRTPAPHPRRGRMTVVTWIGIFPLVYVYERIVSWIMPPDTPILLRIAVITALVVPTMSYLVSPQLTRLFKKWLYPGPS